MMLRDSSELKEWNESFVTMEAVCRLDIIEIKRIVHPHRRLYIIAVSEHECERILIIRHDDDGGELRRWQIDVVGLLVTVGAGRQ
jgi:hypothetical protein